jgi:hypothetical protein
MRCTHHIASIAITASFLVSSATADWTLSNLSLARGEHAATTVGDLAIFAGGRTFNVLYSKVDIYNDTTGVWSEDALSVARTNVGAASLGDLAFFAGGAISTSASTDVVDILNTQDMSWTTWTLSQARFGLSATSVGTEVIFAGGVTGGPSNPASSDVVDIYNSALGGPTNPLAWRTETLSQDRGGMSAVTVGHEALFAGGLRTGSVVSDVVDIYDSLTQMWRVAQLFEARSLPVGCSAVVGGKAYFAGGQLTASAISDVIDVYDSQTDSWTEDHLPGPRTNSMTVALGNTLLFAGGHQDFPVPTDLIDTLNTGTGEWGSMYLPSGARGFGAALAIGGKALFAAGYTGGGLSTGAVDIYEPIGLNYCLASANSTGFAGSISALGSRSLSASDLLLSVVGVPDQPFLFFHGGSQNQLPMGNGYLCVTGGLTRILPVGFGSGGLATAIVNLPTVGIVAPGVRNFQCWFRDPAAGGSGFNTSDAISVNFTP